MSNRPIDVIRGTFMTEIISYADFE
ncbi:tRNA-binding protein, partial [Sinorhizobium meliloti]